jgi:hypothetical protein
LHDAFENRSPEIPAPDLALGKEDCGGLTGSIGGRLFPALKAF